MAPQREERPAACIWERFCVVVCFFLHSPPPPNHCLAPTWVKIQEDEKAKEIGQESSYMAGSAMSWFPALRSLQRKLIPFSVCGVFADPPLGPFCSICAGEQWLGASPAAPSFPVVCFTHRFSFAQHPVEKKLERL